MSYIGNKRNMSSTCTDQFFQPKIGQSKVGKQNSFNFKNKEFNVDNDLIVFEYPDDEQSIIPEPQSPKDFS